MTPGEHETLAKVRAHQEWLSRAEVLIQRSAELHSRIVRMAPACTVDQRFHLHGEIALTSRILDQYESHLLKAAAGMKEPKRLKPSAADVFVGGRFEAPAARKRLTAGSRR